MTILITLNMGDITYNDSTYNLLYLKMTSPITANEKKHLYKVTFVQVKSKCIVFLNTVIMSH